MQVNNGGSGGKKTKYDKAHQTPSYKGQKGKSKLSKGIDAVKHFFHVNPHPHLRAKNPTDNIRKSRVPKVKSTHSTSHKSSGHSAYDSMKGFQNHAKSYSQKHSLNTPKPKAHSSVSTTSSGHKAVAHSSSVHSSGKKSTGSVSHATGSSASKSVSKGSVGGSSSGASKTSSMTNLQKMLKSNSDAYYKTQSGLLANQRDEAIRSINTNYQSGLKDANGLISDTNNAFADSKKQINTQAYKDSGVTDLYAYNNGIQNSQQMLAMQKGDNQRSNDAINTAMNDRDKRIADLNTRIADLKTARNSDITGANSTYSNALMSARGTADQQYNQGMFDLTNEERIHQRDRSESLADQARAYAQQKALSGGYSSGGGGGGSRSSASPAKGGKVNSVLGGLANDYGNYKQDISTNALDAYRAKQQKITKGLLPTVPPAMNPTLSAYDNYKMISSDFPVLKGGYSSVSTKKKKANSSFDLIGSY